MTVRIKDIAKKVNRSITTVSRALNGYDDVNPETAKLILQTAREMGYSPNTLAQRLQKQSTDTIGLVVPTFSPRFSDPYFSELLAGIGNKAAELGYDLLVSTRAPGPQEKEVYEKLVKGGRVDGFIIVRTRTKDPRIQFLLDRNYPFTVFGRSENLEKYSYVDEDGYFGMKLVAEHLVNLGHKRIAFITPDLEFAFARERLRGLQDGLQERGLYLEENLIKVGDLTQKSGYECCMNLLKLTEPPTAIVACNDLMAFGAISAAQDSGLEVGKDISITGFDGIPLGEYFHPPLTTVNQPVYKIGGMVCEMLVNIIKGKISEPEHILMKPSLIIRQSTGQLKEEANL